MTHTNDPHGPRIYYVHPLLVGPLSGWGKLLEQVAALGFDHVMIAPPFPPAPHGSVLLSFTHDTLHPGLGWKGDARSGIAEMARLARLAGLSLLMHVVLDAVAADSVLAAAPGPFSEPDTTLDPRRFDPEGDAAHAPLTTPSQITALAAFWTRRFADWATAGVAGFASHCAASRPPCCMK